MAVELYYAAGIRSDEISVRLTKVPFKIRGTQRDYSSKPLKHSIVNRILVFKQ